MRRRGVIGGGLAAVALVLGGCIFPPDPGCPHEGTCDRIAPDTERSVHQLLRAARA